MLRNDGNYTIYRLQIKTDRGNWHYSYNESKFNATDECWQRTGVYGTLDIEKALDAKKELELSKPDSEFRVVEVSVSQSSEVIKTEDNRIIPIEPEDVKPNDTICYFDKELGVLVVDHVFSILSGPILGETITMYKTQYGGAKPLPCVDLYKLGLEEGKSLKVSVNGTGITFTLNKQ